MYQDAISEIKSVRNKTLTMVEDLDQKDFDKVPSPGDWSVGEILDHLILTDEFYKKDVVKLIEIGKTKNKGEVSSTFNEFDVAPRFLPKSFMAFTTPFLSLTNCIFPRILRETIMQNPIIPFQNPDVVQPRKKRKAKDLREELKGFLKKIESLIEENSNLDFEKLKHNHPILGSNTIPQLLKLMARHEQRHQSQIKSTIGS